MYSPLKIISNFATSAQEAINTAGNKESEVKDMPFATRFHRCIHASKFFPFGARSCKNKELLPVFALSLFHMPKAVLAQLYLFSAPGFVLGHSPTNP